LTLNPAGLVSVPRSLEAQATCWPEDGVRPCRIGSALHPSRFIATGFAYSRLPRLSLARHGVRPPDALESEVWEAALGLAFQPNRRVSAGVTFLWQELSLPGLSGVSDGAPSWIAGFLYRPPQRYSPRLGLRYRWGTTWHVGSDDLSGQVQSPPVASAGAAWRYDSHTIVRRLTLSLQSDWVRYSALTPVNPDLSGARDEIDLRVGLEASLPFGCWTGCGRMIQLRVGLLSAGPSPTLDQVETTALQLGQGPGRGNHLTAGASVALRRFHGRIKLDLAYDGRTSTFAVGLGWRFPTAFRADIEDATRR
jgi:hypothetical protein